MYQFSMKWNRLQITGKWNEICTYNFQAEVAEVAEDVAGQGNIPWNEVINVEEASDAELMMFRDNYFKFAKDNFGIATVTILTENLCQRVQRR